MTEDKLDVTFDCYKCGPTVLVLPDEATDDSIATCKSCGVALGRFGDIKAKAMDAAKSHVTNVIKNAFKGRNTKKR